MKKGPVIIIMLIVVIAISAGAFLLWRSHIGQLRDNMETHMSAFRESFEQFEIELALTESMEAKLLAERLRDDDALSEIDIQIRLAEEIILGNALYDEGRYEDARNVYLHSLGYAYNLDLDSGFILDLITTMFKYIFFYEQIEYADNLIAAEAFEAAINIYEEALLVAAALSFEDGKSRAAAGIDHANNLIIAAKRAQAANYTTQGTLSFLDSNYTESIEFFQSAIEIYREIGDTGQISSLNLKIDSAERQIAEQLRREAREEEQRRREAEEEDQRRQELLDAQEADAALGYTYDEPEETNLNYIHNRNISFDLHTLIDNQGQPPASQVRMGNRPGLNEGWYNGCGWIAAYNALIILGNPMHPAEIVNHIEAGGGTVLDGMFGTFPHAIERLFAELEYEVNHTVFTQRLNLDDAIRDSRVSILAYTHTRAAHFIAIEYRPEDGRFIVYNDSFAGRRAADLGLTNAPYPGAVIDSVNSLIRETSDILFSFSLITIS